jgi:hypothetical protein
VRIFWILKLRRSAQLTMHSLGDVVNKWRVRLDLEPVATADGPSLIESQKVPFTYCWSPALIPKPKDWPSHIGTSCFPFQIS